MLVTKRILKFEAPCLSLCQILCSQPILAVKNQIKALINSPNAVSNQLT